MARIDSTTRGPAPTTATALLALVAMAAGATLATAAPAARAVGGETTTLRAMAVMAAAFEFLGGVGGGSAILTEPEAITVAPHRPSAVAPVARTPRAPATERLGPHRLDLPPPGR